MTVFVSINSPIVNESAAFVDFILTLDTSSSSNTITVPYNTNSITASSYSDYTPISGSVTFAPGVLTQTVRVILLPDTRVEASEGFKLSLGTPTNAVLTRTEASATIVDDDTLASLGDRASLSVRGVSVDEAAGTVTLMVSLDKAVSNGFSVSYSTVNASALAGSDYVATSGTLSFSAGEVVKLVTVPISNDTTRELDEQFAFVLGTLGGAGAAEVQLADNSAQVTVGRNDQTALATPVVSVANASVSESAGFVDFVVSLNAPSSNPVSVNYSTNSFTAASYSDYQPQSGTLVFAPGVTTQTVRIAIDSDTTAEATEMFGLNLSNAVNAVIHAGAGMASVIDNDTLGDGARPAALIVQGGSFDEGSGMATFTVMLDRAVGGVFSVAYSTVSGSATAGSDFSAVQGSLVFGPGETVKTISVELLDDAVAELEELLTLNLGAVSGSAAASVQIGVGSAQAVIGRGDQTAIASPVLSVGDAIATESAGYLDFVVSLNAPAVAQVSVGYSTVGVTASSYSDFEPVSGTLVFAPGTTTQTVRVPLVGATLAEGLETFALRLQNAVNAVVGRSFGNAVIVDDDTPADTSTVANLSVRDVIVDEQAGTATFTVLLDKAANNSFSVGYMTANGSARDGSDFTGVQGALHFAPGQTVRTVTLNIAADVAAEADEFFFFKLGVVTGKAADMVQVADGLGQATIGRSDQTSVGTPFVNVSDVVAGEGEGYVDVRVTLSAPALSQVSVNYSTSSSSADSYSDFEPSSGTIVFAPGSTSQSFRVSLINSTAAENRELFYVSLSNASNATIGTAHGTVTVIDNDTLADTISPATLSVSDVVVNESAGSVTFAVVLKGAASGAFSVAYATANASAVAGSDYTGAAGTLTFAPGETVKSVTVNLLSDGIAEYDEVFGLQLGALSGSGAPTVQVSDGLGQAIIARNGLTLSATPSLSVASVSAGEIDGYADFVVSLSAPSANTVAVNFSTSSASASSYSDYEPYSGSLRFAPGVTVQTVRVPVVNDTAAEANEAFTLNLSNPSQATIATGSASATIIDNDTLADTTAPARLTMQAVSVNENAGTVTFALVLSRATTAAFNLAYNTADGSATAGADYVAASGVVGFAPGETVKLVTVALVADPYAEASETFELQLGAPSGAGAATVTLADSRAIATIGNVNVAGTASMVMTRSEVSVTEGNSATFTLSNTGLPAGTQLPFTLSGISAASVAQPLQGAFTVNTNGNASVSFDFLDNLSFDLARLATLSVPGASAGVLVNDALVRSSSAGNDALSGTSANDKIDGGAGLDTLTLSGLSTNYDITLTNGGYFLTDVTGASGRDLLINVERLVFADKTIALDINGTAGQVYRIYQAAFDRQPDQGGVGFWMAQMDRGLSLETVAEGFVQSAEFASVFGVNPSAEAFVSKVYSNVLHRAPDAGGYAFWVGALNNGVSKAVMLAAVSESPENQAQVIGTIEHGFEYSPYP